MNLRHQLPELIDGREISGEQYGPPGLGVQEHFTFLIRERRALQIEHHGAQGHGFLLLQCLLTAIVAEIIVVWPSLFWCRKRESWARTPRIWPLVVLLKPHIKATRGYDTMGDIYEMADLL